MLAGPAHAGARRPGALQHRTGVHIEAGVGARMLGAQEVDQEAEALGDHSMVVAPARVAGHDGAAARRTARFVFGVPRGERVVEGESEERAGAREREARIRAPLDAATQVAEIGSEARGQPAAQARSIERRRRVVHARDADGRGAELERALPEARFEASGRAGDGEGKAHAGRLPPC